jgi:DNA-binding transcriptional LysR family regulator
VSPTTAGIDLARRCAPHLDALALASAPPNSVTETLAGSVFIGNGAGFSSPFLLSFKRGLAVGVAVTLSSGPPPALLEALLEGSLDLAILPARIPHKGIEYVDLYSGSLLLLTARASARGSSQPPSPTDVPLIGVSIRSAPLDVYWKTAFQMTAPPASLMVQDFEVALNAVRAGLGASVVPELLCKPALRSRELVLAARPDRVPTISLHIAQAAGKTSSRRVTLIRDQLINDARRW